MPEERPLRVNPAPVLTLWVAVVAERQGHPPETALSLASAVAGTAARARARPVGPAEDRAPAPLRAVRLLGREVAVTEIGGTTLAAGPDGEPAPAAPVQAYLVRAFGPRLAAARQAMEQLAATLPPEALNRIGFQLYERFRPDLPEGAAGWAAKGTLHLHRIRDARP